MQTLQYLKMEIYYKSLMRKARSLVALMAALFLIGILWHACSEKALWHGALYRIAYDNAWRPAVQFEQQRNISAFSMELLLAIAKEENLQLELVRTSPEHLLVGLENGEYDAALSFQQPDAETPKHYLFSDPLYLNGPVLVVMKSSNINSLQQIEGKTIGVARGESIVFDMKQYPSFLIISYDNTQQALVSLSKNSIDGVIIDLLPAYAYVMGLYAGKLKIATRPLTDEGLRLCALRTPFSEALIQRIDKGLGALKANGSYQALGMRWSIYLPE